MSAKYRRAPEGKEEEEKNWADKAISFCKK